MIVDFLELHKKIINCYFSDDDYSYINDPSLTYQECVLIEEVLRITHINADMAGYQPLITSFDFDTLPLYVSDEYASLWNQCVAKLFQPIEINKPWTDVIIDKNLNKSNIPTVSYNNEFWENSPPFDVIHEDEKRVYQALYKDYRIRVGAKVPDYNVCGEVYEIKS